MEKYSETITELNQRQFNVYTMDWRGQGLSSRQLPNRHKGYVRSYDDYIDDLGRFVNHIVKPRAASPLIMLTHSMGGHIALRFLHKHTGIVDRAVLLSPMIDIATSFVNGKLLRVFAWLGVAAGLATAYVVGSGDYGAADQKFSGNRLTSDPMRFRKVQELIARNPDLALGGVTFGWLRATLESIEMLNQPGYAGGIATPILIVMAGSDRVVSMSAQVKICDILPNCRLSVIPEARHEILLETDPIRQAFWKEFDHFAGSSP